MKATCLIVAAVSIGACSASIQAGDKAPKPVSKKAVTAKAPPDAENLLKNGDFELPNKTKDGPLWWQPMDNLVYHWTTDPKAPDRGKVLRIDTSVDESYAYGWWIGRYLHEAPLADAPSKVEGSGFSHLGGNTGGFCWSSHFIPVKKGGAYKVFVDAKGPGCKVIVRGYEEVMPVFFGDEQPLVQQRFREARGDPTHDENGRPIRYRLRYRYQRWFAAGGSDEWKTYTHNKPCHPNSREITEDVAFIRIMLYPYWTPADYWFDNIRVIEVEPDLDQAKPPADEADVEEGKVVK